MRSLLVILIFFALAEPAAACRRFSIWRFNFPQPPARWPARATCSRLQSNFASEYPDGTLPPSGATEPERQMILDTSCAIPEAAQLTLLALVAAFVFRPGGEDPGWGDPALSNRILTETVNESAQEIRSDLFLR
jgi:hypothetical protein